MVSASPHDNTLNIAMAPTALIPITPNDLRHRFRDLQIWKHGDLRAPHKPLLALWALGRCLRGQSRMVPYSEVEPALTKLLQQFGPPRKVLHPEDPFWRLQTDGLWDIPDAGRIATTATGGAELTSLRRHNPRAGFPPAVFDALRNDEQLAIDIACSLVEEHFPPSLHDTILEATGIEPQVAWFRRRIRNRAFSRAVLAAYDSRCAVCGFAIRLLDRPMALDAAHIKWHAANGPDLIPNALALCALHHRLFDGGAFTVGFDRRILVADAATGPGRKHALTRFRGESLRPPSHWHDRPVEEYLDWHRREVFRESADA